MSNDLHQAALAYAEALKNEKKAMHFARLHDTRESWANLAQAVQDRVNAEEVLHVEARVVSLEEAGVLDVR